MRAYAIGDIHGHLGLLQEAHVLIARDRRLTGDDTAPVVHLGDLVDRGPDSAGVIDWLVAGPAKGGPWITLKGNHDFMFALFLDDPRAKDPGLRPDLSWLHPRLGGPTTLASYGIADVAARTLDDLHEEALAKVPPAHRRFLEALPLTHQTAGAVFVHAGLRPGLPLAQQKPTDLMWIRAEFHNDRRDHGGLVVHGHTPVDVPKNYGNRLNIDTGAAYGGPLTVVVIEDGKATQLTEDGRIPLAPLTD